MFIEFVFKYREHHFSFKMLLFSFTCCDLLDMTKLWTF